MTDTSAPAYETWIDRQVVDNDGHRIGIVADVYLDDASGYPEWLAVMTGLFGTRLSFVPIAGAVEAGGKVCIAFSRAFVKDSPNIDSEGTLTVEEEERLYRHYGMDYSTPQPFVLMSEDSPAESKQRKLRSRLRRLLHARSSNEGAESNAS